MKNACLVVAMAAALAAAPARAHRRDPEVRGLVNAFARTWATNDPQKLSAFFEDHGDLINPQGRRAHGRMEIEKLFQDEHFTVFKGSKMSVAFESIRYLDDDIAFVDASLSIEGVKAPDAAPVTKYHLVAALRRNHDHWKFATARPYVLPGKP